MGITDIRDKLVSLGQAAAAGSPGPVKFTGHRDADALLNDLVQFPHAFVLASLMDRQIKAEKAWLIPFRVKERLGSFDFTDLAKLSGEDVRKLITVPENLHRFPEVMARNFHGAIRRIAEEYSGNASQIWANSPSSATIVRRFLQFEGAGPKIATMAANILVRDFRIPVNDRYSIDVSPDVQVRRVFVRLGLIEKQGTNEELIYRARELHPVYPGIFDFSVWEIGRKWCRPKDPQCTACCMNSVCPKRGI